MNLPPCKRTIQYMNKIEHISVDEHSFRWSGEIPCTGEYRCIYCQKTKEELLAEAADQEADAKLHHKLDIKE